MKKNIILLSIGVMALCGCTRDEANAPSSGDAVNFTAGIETLTRTTDGGDVWVAGDQVGIYMLTAEGDIATPADVLANNAKYSVTDAATGALAHDGGSPIYYPQSGTVDFVAYYPYATVAGGLYNIGIAGQTDAAAQNSLDVLYAKKTGVAKTQTAVGLVFDHVLSKVTLNVTLGDGLSALTSDDITAATLGGMPLTAMLDLQDGTLTAGATTGTFVALKSATPDAGSAATFTALVVPHPGAIGRTVTFTVDGADYTGTFPANDFTKGKNHTYTVTVQKTRVEIGTHTITPWTPHDGGTIDGSTTTGHDHEGYYYTAEAWRFIQWAQLTDGWQTSGFTLASDIDLTGFDWTPVGDGSTRFTQTFDGGGHAITGLSVNSGFTYVGLFGVVGSGGKVLNVTVSGTVTGTGMGIISSVGGIAGLNSSGAITGCSFSGTVTCTNIMSNVGGIAGLNYGPITGCTFSGTVACTGSNSYVSGIAGWNDGTITGSWSAASSVTGGSGSLVGGIVGMNGSGTTIKNCHWLWDNTISTGFDGNAVGGGSADASCSSFATVQELNGKVPGMNSAISSSGWQWVAGLDPTSDWPTIKKIP